MSRNLILGSGILVFVSGLNLALAQVSTGPLPTVTAKHLTLEHLRQAHRLLVEADHDYDGHRARAAEELHKAIRELEGKHHANAVQPGIAPTVTSKPATPNSAAHHESQGNSDAQLRQALQLLQGTMPHLSGNHPKAATRVNAAIREIEISLKLK
jgi:hypothetical protein